MRLNKPSPGALRRLAELAAEPLRIGREMVLIALELWFGVAEIAGRGVLAGWRALRPLLTAVVRAAVGAIGLAQREVTPARATVAVAIAAAAALAASQWADYREVRVATGQYSGVEGIAPPPEVERERAGDAHAWSMLPIAAAAVAAIGLAAWGRRRHAAVALLPLGAVAIAVAVLIDVPQGLDEGSAALAYEGAQASLIEGFWAQVAAAAVLCVCGLLLPGSLRRTGVGLKSRRRSPDRSRERMGISEATGA